VHQEKRTLSILPAKFIDDVKEMELEQVVSSADKKFFLGVYFDERGSLSGHKVVRLYDGRDSLSVDEANYGGHPLEVVAWGDSTITFKARVFSAHGDSAYRKWYLDASVDKNKRIGSFAIRYQKNYNSWPSDSH
jgi:hypothetical protein